MLERKKKATILESRSFLVRYYRTYFINIEVVCSMYQITINVTQINLFISSSFLHYPFIWPSHFMVFPYFSQWNVIIPSKRVKEWYCQKNAWWVKILLEEYFNQLRFPFFDLNNVLLKKKLPHSKGLLQNCNQL